MHNHGLAQNLSSEEKEILLHIQKARTSAKEALLQKTGMKSTSINRVLEHLRRKQLIVVCGEGDSTGGRKPLLYSLNPAIELYTVGLNIALYHLDIAVLSLMGNPVVHRIAPCNREVSPREAVRVITDILEEQLAIHGIHKEQILGCGLSASSPMDRRQGVLVRGLSFDFSDPRWEGFPILQALEKEIGLKILTMDTTANAGCIGEYLYGHGRNHEKVLNIICGNAIRVGCITNGALVRPTNDLANAFGHMAIVANGEPCSCGNFGCIDCYATGRAIRKYYADETKKGRGGIAAAQESENSGTIRILKAADQGEPLAVETISKAAAMLGIGLANYINLINPDIVTCSGYLIEESRLYYEVLVDVTKKKISCLGFPRRTLFTRRSDTGKAVIGASVMAMEAFFGKFY